MNTNKIINSNFSIVWAITCITLAALLLALVTGLFNLELTLPDNQTFIPIQVIATPLLVLKAGLIGALITIAFLNLRRSHFKQKANEASTEIYDIYNRGGVKLGSVSYKNLLEARYEATYDPKVNVLQGMHYLKLSINAFGSILQHFAIYIVLLSALLFSLYGLSAEESSLITIESLVEILKHVMQVSMLTACIHTVFTYSQTKAFKFDYRNEAFKEKLYKYIPELEYCDDFEIVGDVQGAPAVLERFHAFSYR